jgi:hypothetical protein
MTAEDVQAVLWYPETDLWAKLSGEDESNPKSSYEEEFIKLAEQRGLGDEARRVAAAVVKRRSRGASRAGSPDVTQPDGRVLGRVDRKRQAKERQSIQSQSPADLLKQVQAQKPSAPNLPPDHLTATSFRTALNPRSISPSNPMDTPQSTFLDDYRKSKSALLALSPEQLQQLPPRTIWQGSFAGLGTKPASVSGSSASQAQ